MNEQRASVYRFLARLFSAEADDGTLALIRAVRFPEDGFPSGGARFNAAAAAASADLLAEDFARVFLGAGLADAAAAFPYESVYTSPKGIIMQDAWSRMRETLRSHGAELAVSSPDLLEDHVSVELEYMAWLIDAGDAEQETFLSLHLLNWLPRFCADVVKYARTEFYRAAAELLISYVEYDAGCLASRTEDRSAEDVPEAEPAQAAPAVSVSFALTQGGMEESFHKLCEKYDVYGPAEDESGIVRFRPLSRFGEAVNSRQSDFSAKEVYYPISQTLFRFDENGYTEVLPEFPKPVIILAHACDINAVRRLDRIFLSNGGRADAYYAALRRRVKFALLECPEGGFENCFCVSMGSNSAEDYAAAFSTGPDGVRVLVKDAELLPFFEGAEEAPYVPRAVTRNSRGITLPRIGELKNPSAVFGLPMWAEESGKCISCGGCNAVCPTCSCYETADFLDQEDGRRGERRRVWASCMRAEFSRTAGGGEARTTPDKLMRFRVMHKIYDFNARFGGTEHMCVGCGRCTLRCPEKIDFLAAVQRLHGETERLIAEQEERS